MKRKLNIYQNIGFIFQAIITMFVLFSMILSSLVEGMDNLTKVLISLMFFGLAFNNHFTFKRKWFTLLYFIMSIIALGSML